MYSSDYGCQDIMKAIIEAVKEGIFPNEELVQLKNGLKKLKYAETYKSYGVPYTLYLWEKFRKTNIE